MGVAADAGFWFFVGVHCFESIKLIKTNLVAMHYNLAAVGSFHRAVCLVEAWSTQSISGKQDFAFPAYVFLDWKFVRSEQLPDVLTTQQAAKVLGLSVSSVQKLVISGELEAWTTPGGHRRIDRQKIERLLQSRNPSTALKTHGPHRSMRILLAEDDPIQAKFFQSILEKLAFAVDLTVATDASMALIQLERQRPDLVVTDLMMEPFDGYHLIRTLETEPAYYPIDVIVLSAMDKTEAMERGHLPDWVTYYKKPVPTERMMGYLDSMQTRVIKRFTLDDSNDSGE